MFTNVYQCILLHTQCLPLRASMLTNVYCCILIIYQCLQLHAPMLNITVVNNTCLPLNAPKHRSSAACKKVANNMHHPGEFFLKKYMCFLTCRWMETNIILRYPWPQTNSLILWKSFEQTKKIWPTYGLSPLCMFEPWIKHVLKAQRASPQRWLAYGYA